MLDSINGSESGNPKPTKSGKFKPTLTVTVKLEPKTYDILGDVAIEGTTRSIMGLFTWGGATYYDLIQKAQKIYKADDVINISLDKRAGIFLGVYYTNTYVLRGIAVKYK